MAKIIKKITKYTGGTESSIEGLSKFILIAGILVSIVSFIVAGFATKDGPYDHWAENGFSSNWIAISISSFIQGIGAWIILRGFADVIRLLKKITGIQYGGTIIESKPNYGLICSECGDPMGYEYAKCPNCGVVFEKDESSEIRNENANNDDTSYDKGLCSSCRYYHPNADEGRREGACEKSKTVVSSSWSCGDYISSLD